MRTSLRSTRYAYALAAHPAAPHAVFPNGAGLGRAIWPSPIRLSLPTIRSTAWQVAPGGLRLGRRIDSGKAAPEATSNLEPYPPRSQQRKAVREAPSIRGI